MVTDEEPPCDFTGSRLNVSEDNTLTLDQNSYLFMGNEFGCRMAPLCLAPYEDFLANVYQT